MITPNQSAQAHHNSAVWTDGTSANGHLKPRLLVVDDVRAIHDDFRKILANRQSAALSQASAALFGNPPAAKRAVDFLLDSAYQGNEALSLVQRALAETRPYALAFVDVRMPPGWDGIETTERLWAADPDLQVVLCTAYSDYSWNDIFGRLGRDG